jgi:hypothetical protein
MKKTVIAIALSVFVTGLAEVAHADLDSFLSNVNVQARADMNGFSIRLGAQFGVPVPQVQAILRTVESPADAFMCLQLGHMTHKQPEVVMATYESHKGKGWGVIAKELGIKPGSGEFHALKRGDFVLAGEPGGSADNGQGKGKSKGKGNNK